MKFPIQSVAVGSVVGMAIGLLVDRGLLYLQRKYNIKPGFMVVIQLVILIFIFYLLEKHLFRNNAQWRDGIIGIFLIGFIFNVQLNFYNNIELITEERLSKTL